MRVTPTAHIAVPRLDAPVIVDGQLTEACYSRTPLVHRFVIAGAPDKTPPRTRAWLFWQQERLIFAFDVEDAENVAAPERGQERDVDSQDRVELFLWSGRTNDAYYCIEIGARGAVHDYAARFYRRFDDTWSPVLWKYAVAPALDGYRVEGELSREALARMGFQLVPGARFYVGLFRADFRPTAPDDPIWICWVDARGPQPDFHVAGSFQEIILSRTP